MTLQAKRFGGRSYPHGKWYVPVPRCHGGYYLHRDGVVRYSTDYNGEMTGYFDTESEASAAIEAYEAKQEEVGE